MHIYRDLHGNGDDGNTTVMETTAAVMGTVVAVIPRERLLLKRYYCDNGPSGHRIL